MINRVVVIVLDSFGVGELPDANLYNDEGTNTFRGIYENANLELPNLRKMGLYNIDEIGIDNKIQNTIRSIRKSY